MPRTNEELLRRARAMRAEMTPPEQHLWFALRAKRFTGVKFSRQVVIGTYIVDFAARSRKLVIELDGDSHACQERYDAQRSLWLEQQGYRVMRFTNADVTGNLEGVLGVIGDTLAPRPLSQPSPHGGEGLE